MATVRWVGNAAPVADVWTFTVSAIGSNGDTVYVTCNSKTVTVAKTASETTTALLAALLQTSLAACTFPEFQEYTWTVSSNVVTATANTAGKPGTFTSGETGTAAITESNATAATGPNFASNVTNWSGGALPTTSDDVVFENSNVDCLYGLTALSAVTLTSITVRASYTGRIGLPERAGGSSTIAPGGSGGYYEYRPRYFQFDGDCAVTIGDGTGAGSGRINLEGGDGATTVLVFGTAQPEDGVAAFHWKTIGSGTGNTLSITQGSVGLALDTGAVCKVTPIRVGSEGNPANDVTLRCGAGAVLNTVVQHAGKVEVNSTVASLTMQRDANEYTQSAGALTAATVYGGTLYYNSTSTLASVTAYGPSAKVNFSRDPRAKTLTDGSFKGGAAFIDPNFVVTMTNPMTVDGASVKASDFGTMFSVKRT